MALKTLPEINFATADPLVIALEVVSTVETLLGRTLERADPLRIFLRGVEAIIIQQRLLIDQTAKMNLLAYATGAFLDHLGALVGCERLDAAQAVTTVELTLSAARLVPTTILAGTRFNAGDDVYFALDEDLIFLAGETVKTAKATCTTAGASGNGYEVGEIKRIVDPQAFLQSVTNVTVSEGGADVEGDDSYRERIHTAPEAYSCAGSEGAYVYHTKSVSPLISDVAVDSPVYEIEDVVAILADGLSLTEEQTAALSTNLINLNLPLKGGRVNIYVLLQGGELPGEEMLSAVNEHLSGETIRPLTDLVTVLPPSVVEYEIDATYWIAASDSARASVIQTQAAAAVEDYVEWQREKLGRDLNPSELIYRLKAAGVKRVEVTSPVFTVMSNFTVAIPTAVNVTFAGLEDD